MRNKHLLELMENRFVCHYCKKLLGKSDMGLTQTVGTPGEIITTIIYHTECYIEKENEKQETGKDNTG